MPLNINVNMPTSDWHEIMIIGYIRGATSAETVVCPKVTDSYRIQYGSNEDYYGAVLLSVENNILLFRYNGHANGEVHAMYR